MFDRTREKLKNDENKVIVAKISDKYEFAITKNKITYTDFLDMNEVSIANQMLKEENIENYIFYGVRNNAERIVLIFYPEKFSKEMVEKNYNKIFNIINIKLPKELKYEHREYLSGIMKLGIKREKFGDIIVKEDGASIITLSEVANYLVQGLRDLTRFKKSIINLDTIENFQDVENLFQDLTFIVASLRLDSFVSEIAKCSRTQAISLVEEGRCFINQVLELKPSKTIKENDIINVRGKGKYIFINVEKETRSNRLLVNMKKYI